jgi:ABC-type antimicrobial peptide transport system permease subunit
MPAALQRIERVRAAIATAPGVDAVSAATVTPLSGLMAAADVSIPGSLAPPIAGFLPFNSVLPGYFATLGTPLLVGRDFNEMDVSGGPDGGRRVAIVNQALAQEHFGGYSPIGRVLMVAKRPVEIVGVVANTRAMTLREDRDVAMVYAPLAQRTSLPNLNLRWVIRTSEPDRARFTVPMALRSVDPLIGAELRTMEDEALTSINRERLLAWVGAGFATLGLLLAGVGVYGTFTYAVNRRRREISVRLAVGASRADIFRILGRDAIVVIGGGVAVGFAGAMATTKTLGALLYGTSARDFQTIAIAVLTAFAAAAVATYIPARAAAATDPAHASRE